MLLAVLLPLHGMAQDAPLRSVYYAGVNPVAPFTSIRSDFASGALPAFSNLETGASLFIGKLWNRRYNVETRLSYGSPFRHARQFMVQSGMHYCFSKPSPGRSLLHGAYAGLFVKLQSLRLTGTSPEQSSLALYWSAGKRFVRHRWFADVRVNQHILGIKWTNEPHSKAAFGFHASRYNWSSPYVPFAGAGIGYIISR